jgi:hypothetical protein
MAVVAVSRSLHGHGTGWFAGPGGWRLAEVCLCGVYVCLCLIRLCLRLCLSYKATIE